MSEINKGPINLHHILKRRRVDLPRWAESEGISTKQDFLAAKARLEASGHFFAEEMLLFGANLPDAASPGSLPEESSPELGPSDEPEPKPRSKKPKVAPST